MQRHFGLMLTLICFYAWWFNWVSKIPHRKICTSITTWVHIHKNLSTINVIQWHENNIKLLILVGRQHHLLFFPPEKAVLAIIPQSKCIYLLVERSDHLTWLVLMEWWKVGNDFYTVLIWRVHTTYNMGESKKYYICICCISLSSRIYVRHCPMHFWPPDWITNVCIEHEVTVKKYTLSFLPYWDQWCTKGFWWHFYILVQKYRSV